MPSFSTLSGFEEYVKRQLEDVQKNEVAQKAKEDLKKSMEKHIYSRPVSEYDRTNELLNSSNYSFETKGNMLELSVFNDTSSSSMPSGHPSWVDGSYQNNMIPIWMEYGNYSSGSNPIYRHDPTNYFSLFIKDFKPKYKQVVIAGLKKRGIIAK